MSNHSGLSWTEDSPVWVLIGAFDAVIILSLVHLEPSWTLLLLAGVVLTASGLVRHWSPRPLLHRHDA